MPSPAGHNIPIAEFVGALSDLQTLLRRAANVMAYDTTGLPRIARESAELLAAAGAVMLVGGILLSFGLVYGLAALVPAVPLAAWFAMAGLAAMLAGTYFLSNARAKLTTLQPLQERSAAVASEAGQVVDHVNEAIGSTKDAIHNTVESMKATVESVKHATDLNYQVAQRPWAMFAGAASLGFVGGALLKTAAPKTSHHYYAQTANGTPAAPGENGSGFTHTAPQVTTSHAEPGMFAKLGEALAPQAEVIRELAIGTLFSLARDLAHDAVAKPLSEPIDEFFNGAAKHFGGRPLAPGHFKSAATATAHNGHTTHETH